MSNTYDIVSVRGHYEVYHNGKFIFSADTMSEAVREIRSAKEKEEQGK